MRKDASGWSVRFSDEDARQLRAAGVWRGRTIVDDATEAAAAVPDQICLRDGARAISYRDILLEAQALAAGLAERGLLPGQVVAFQLPNWIEAAAAASLASSTMVRPRQTPAARSCRASSSLNRTPHPLASLRICASPPWRCASRVGVMRLFRTHIVRYRIIYDGPS